MKLNVTVLCSGRSDFDSLPRAFNTDYFSLILSCKYWDYTSKWATTGLLHVFLSTLNVIILSNNAFKTKSLVADCKVFTPKPSIKQGLKLVFRQHLTIIIITITISPPSAFTDSSSCYPPLCFVVFQVEPFWDILPPKTNNKCTENALGVKINMILLRQTKTSTEPNTFNSLESHALALTRRLPTAASRRDHVGFMVDKVVLNRFSLRTSVSPVNSHSTNCSLFISRLIIDTILWSQYWQTR
jgi:hypothetical protein